MSYSTFKVTSPEVPPPLKPLPAVTAVMSPIAKYPDKVVKLSFLALPSVSSFNKSRSFP